MAKPRKSASASRWPLGLWLGMALLLPAWAGDAGTVTQLAGVLSAQAADGSVRVLAASSQVASGDLLSTGARSYARIRFLDGAELTLRPNTVLRVDDFRFEQTRPEEDSALLRLIRGGLRAVSGLVGKRGQPEAYRMDTPTATIGIRGTHYGALFCQADCGGLTLPNGQQPANGLYVDVADGRIMLSNAQGSQLLGAGEFGYVPPGGAPAVLPPGQGLPLAQAVGQPDSDEDAALGTPPDEAALSCTLE